MTTESAPTPGSNAPGPNDRARRLVDMYVTPAGSAQPAPPPAFPPAFQPTFQPPTATAMVTQTSFAPPVIGYHPPPSVTATIDGGPPSLPTVTLPTPSAPTSLPNPTYATFTELGQGPPGSPKKIKRQRGETIRRATVRLFMLAIVAAVATAGAIYGPPFVERFTGDEDPAATTDESPAPLVLPPPPVTDPIVRTATFEIEDVANTGAVSDIMRVTTDFDTGATRTVSERTGGTDVEVLALFDEAVIRSLNAPTWYRLGRGPFPFEGNAQRADWVPTIDALIPAEQRDSAVITSATHSAVNGVPATHLVIEVGTVPREIWVDDAGIVRKQVTQTTLGSRTITVLDVSAEPWLPEFPTPDQVQPITAAALVDMGI